MKSISETDSLPPVDDSSASAVNPVQGIDQSAGDFTYDVKYDFDAGTGLTKLSRTSRSTVRSLDSLQPAIVEQLRSVDTVLVQAQGMLVALRTVARGADTSVLAASRSLEPLTRDDSLLRRIESSMGVIDAIQGFVDGKSKIKYHFHIWGDNPSKHGE